MNPVFKVKKAFMDRTKIVRYMDKKTRIAFMRYGGLVRKVAQRSMRSRKGSSPEGTPPYAHGKKQLRKLLFFSYDESSQTLVVGPVLLQATAGDMVPSTHEHGGAIAFNRGSKGLVTSHYAPRPYMKPAHEISVPKLIEGYKS